MADEKNKPSGQMPEATKEETPKVETPKIDEEISKKYTLHPCIQPAVMDFGPRFGNTTMDMRKVKVAEVDAFVAKFKNQHYFKPKNG